MTFTWDAKNNFILLHFITLDQQQSSISDINWSSIVNDISFEISSTPSSLKNQYEHLLETFYPKQDSKSLHATLKHIYLHALCQKIEDDLSLTLETVYELIRHVRAKRIHSDDIEQLLKEWNFDYSSDVQKKNKERLFDVLNRLRDYIHAMFSNDYRPIRHYLSERSTTVEKEMQDEDLESVSNDEHPTMNIRKSKQNELMHIDNDRIVSNINEEKKSSSTRRRSQSLTVFAENNDNKVNIGVEWFVPKLKRQQRSSSLHARCQSPSIIDSSSSQNQNNILLTTIDNDESSSSTSNSNLRQTNAQPTISWLPRTTEQIAQAERRQIRSNFFENVQLDQVSSDSDTIEIQWTSLSSKKSSESLRSQATSSLPHDLHQQEHSSRKRQRLS